MSDTGGKWMLVLVTACICSNLAPSWILEEQGGYGAKRTYTGYQALWNRPDGAHRELNMPVMAFQNGAFLVGAIGIFLVFKKPAPAQTPLPAAREKAKEKP